MPATASAEDGSIAGTLRDGDASQPILGPRRSGWSATSAHRGVYPTPEGRWAAKIRVAGRLHYCGTWDTEAEAAVAVRGREVELLGGA